MRPSGPESWKLFALWPFSEEGRRACEIGQVLRGELCVGKGVGVPSDSSALPLTWSFVLSDMVLRPQVSRVAREPACPLLCSVLEERGGGLRSGILIWKKCCKLEVIGTPLAAKPDLRRGYL